MNAIDTLTNAIQHIRENQRQFGEAKHTYSRGSIIASVLRDTDTSAFDTIAAEISNKLSKLSQNRMDADLWIALCADVAMAAQIASDARVVNPSVAMAEFKEGVEQELEAQMIANGIKAINENR